MKKITLIIITFILTSAAHAESNMKAFHGVKTITPTQEELVITVPPNPQIVELRPYKENVVVLLPPDPKKVVRLLPPDKKIVRKLFPR
jgi:hypothetical protein